MEVCNLMLGDWVSLFQGKEDGSSANVQVTSIDKYEIGVAGVDCGYDSATAPLLFPIPLNAEMLEKNTKKVEGFTGWLYWIDVNEQCYVRKYDGEYTFMYKRGFAEACIPIEFVHQLQHCLKMFGISKEIVL